jgi:hypothetical protein
MSVGYTLKNGHWVWHQTPLKDKESRKKYAAYRASPSTYKVYHYNAKAAARAKAQALARAKAKADGERRKKEGIKGKILGFIHEHRSAIELIGDAGQFVNYTATGLAGACVVVTMGACAAGPAEGLATIGKIGAGVSAASAVLQAVDSCTSGSRSDCIHDGWGAASSTMEIAIPYLPSGGTRLVTRIQEAYTSGDNCSLIGRVTRWMFPRD